MCREQGKKVRTHGLEAIRVSRVFLRLSDSYASTRVTSLLRERVSRSLHRHSADMNSNGFD